MEFDEILFRKHGPNTTLWGASDREKSRAVIGQVYKAGEVAIAKAEKGVRTCSSRSADACKLCIETGWNIDRECKSPITS